MNKSMSVVSLSKGTSECWINFSCLSPQAFWSLLFKTNTRTHLIEKVSDFVWWRVIGGWLYLELRVNGVFWESEGVLFDWKSSLTYRGGLKILYRWHILIWQWTYMRMKRGFPPNIGNCEYIKMIVKWANQKCLRMLPFLKQLKEKNW